MFRKKKKEKLFGNGIEPECRYCENHSESQGTCRLGLGTDASVCGKFRYDPLKRTPDEMPPLKYHDPDEFKL